MPMSSAWPRTYWKSIGCKKVKLWCYPSRSTLKKYRTESETNRGFGAHLKAKTLQNIIRLIFSLKCWAKTADEVDHEVAHASILQHV